MEKPRKPSVNNQLFEKEVKRLQRLVKIAEKKGIVFIRSPIPQKPDKVTRKKLTEISTITATDIQSKGYTIDTETGELTRYNPPKQSKPRRVSTPSYQPDINSPRIPTAKIKQPLTPEELHKIRSEAAKKAAATRAKREAEDPAYRARMQEIRRRNLEKARKAQKEFAEKHPEEAARRRSEAAKKAAETRRKKQEEQEEFGIPKKPKPKTPDKKPETPKPTVPETPQPTIPEAPTPEEPEPIEPEIPDDYDEEYEPIDAIPNRGYEILQSVRRILSHANNQQTADFLLRELESEVEQLGEDVMVFRLARFEDAISKAEAVAYDSDNEKLKQNAAALAAIIYGGVTPPYILEEIEELANEDIPKRWKVTL